ncbi:MAG: aromatic amino acid hydroxylase [Bacteroidota bacterium]
MPKNIPLNPVLAKLPKHLYQYVHPQNYDRYSPIDQAVWRYVMRRNVDFLSQVAHHSYLDGLKKTGISTDAIPNMYGMNRILQEIGWAAVAVDGFIPPTTFMEFQAYNVLVIAADIRQIDHIQYTPAPDIIHESAGHAPIIANPEYAEYLRRFGEIGCKAISSHKDFELYQAVRHLSILKEQENTPANKIAAAEATIIHLQQNMGTPSEMALIRNLHWWTVEYGLIGTLDNPKIYGAGLLSSIGESKLCLSDKVKKIPYDLNAAYQSFDITKPQPQLFITPNFSHLSLILEEFANTMSLRKGGLMGLHKLMESKQLGTIELSTGLQISGHFTKVIENGQGKVAFFQTTGPTALAYQNKELIGHSTARHSSGFGSPVGKLRGINLAIEDMSPRDLDAYNIYEGKTIELEFEGDVFLTGQVITGTRNLQGKILLIAFKDCQVRHRDQTIFTPDQGIYHLAVGKEVVSAFAGPADNQSFDLVEHQLSTKEKKSTDNLRKSRLEKHFQTIRSYRSGKSSLSEIQAVAKTVLSNFPNQWLLLLELYEVLLPTDKRTADKVFIQLSTLQDQQPSINELISEGLKLIEQSSLVE